MGFLDDAKKKLGDAVDKHGDKISDGLDKAGDAIDKKTGGKHSDKIRSGVGQGQVGAGRPRRQADDPAETSDPQARGRATPRPGPRPGPDRPARPCPPSPVPTRTRVADRGPTRPPAVTAER